MRVKTDIARNRMIVEISGSISKDILDKLYTDVRFHVADLKPNFVVITDLGKCTIAHLDGISTYRKIMKFLVRSGMGGVIRLIGPENIFFKQVFNLTSQICSYIPNYVSTLEEAEELLSTTRRRRGLRFHFVELPPARFLINETEAEGRIVDISISGCKIVSSSIVPAVGDLLELMLTFHPPDVQPACITLQSKVVRATSEDFAVAYENVDTQTADQLWDSLTHEFDLEYEKGTSFI